jgi:hypothetical protein
LAATFGGQSQICGAILASFLYVELLTLTKMDGHHSRLGFSDTGDLDGSLEAIYECGSNVGFQQLDSP